MSQEITLRDVVESGVVEFSDPIVLEQVALAVPEGISPQKLLRVAATAVNKNPELGKPALRVSLLHATIDLAPTGLMPDGKEAAFVVFGNKVVAMPMVLGLRKIAAEYGWSLLAAVVHENDQFDPDPETGRANYKPARLGTDPGEAIGAYAVADHKDGRHILEVMNLQEIEAVRATSRAKNSGPWVEWWGEMARKTVVRRLFKSLPLDEKDRGRIDRVLAATDLDTGERVELLYGTDSSLAAGDERTPAETAPQSSPAAASSREVSGSTTAGPETPDVIDLEAEEIPFEGEEPPPVPDEPEAEPTFTSGRYSGKTLEQVLGSGKDGLSYVRWAYKSWKSEPLRSALDRFAEKNPAVKS